MMRSLIKLRRRAALVALGLGFGLQPAAAQQIPLRYEIRWTDAVVTGSAALLAVIPKLRAARLPHATCAPCDPGRLWGIDRGVIGELRPGPAKASDATLVTTVFAAGAFMLDARAAEPGNAKWEDLAVYSQALAVDAALTQWAKVLFHRPRPPRYTAAAVNYPEPEWGLSFPSGHSSVAFTAAAAYASMMQRRHLGNQQAPEIALLFGTAAATAVLRVIARKHFPTDVIAGAVLGSAIGWVVPQVHRIQ